ncbi:hypothetical protein GO988_08270 [Hymenobacter sp. HMF4947]|uniref:HTH luxR-type domain-containing protein n=1 Tax=Hymenobacter ginkgonis TaxID=2682976 RepID=A0A7K1TD43_9BACT|nr:response regulator transcription factor [Hymenobacter ginkgonis]MVN76318.1 hypothetical protein [Hymenobacter ginkgonis]
MATLLPDTGLLVAAPPTLLRHGLLVTLRETWPDCPIHFTTDPAQLPALLRQQPCALLIVDGPALPATVLPTMLQQIQRQHPQLPLLVLTGRRPPSLPQARPDAATLRLLSRQATPSEVAGAVVDLLAEGHVSTLPAPARPRALPPRAGFSPRELEVLSLVVDDLCNEQIAERLCLSVRTVESHRRALLQKAGVRTLVGLVVRAIREGWVSA